MINKKNRQDAYRASSDAMKDLYGLEKLDVVLDELTTKYKTSSKLKELIGDTVLGFHKTSELTELLQKEVGVSADDAQRIYNDLKEFLAPVIAREKGEVNPNHEELKELQEVFTPPSPTVTETPSAEANTEVVQNLNAEVPVHTTAPEEKELSEVQPMRTMEGDISRIHGYGAYRAQFPEEPKEAEHKEEIIRSASQEDILKEKPTLAGMPSYTKEESGT